MATLTEVESFRSTLDDVNTMAARDLDMIFSQIVAGLSLQPWEVRDVLADVMPGVMDPYASTIGNITTDFYYTDRTAQGVSGYYRGTPAAQLPAEGQMRSLAGKATSVLYKDPMATAAAVGLLVGGAQRLLFNVERDTTWELAGNDPSGPVNYQRMTTSDEPCDFCIVLASRGAVFSEESSEQVVGRGVPVRITRNGRRMGGGIRPRGPRTIGEAYHDNDKCVGIAVHAGNDIQMQMKAAEHFDRYAEARAWVSENQPRDLKWTQTKAPDGSLKRKYRWEDSATNEIINDKAQTRRILAAMRRIRKEQSGA